MKLETNNIVLGAGLISLDVLIWDGKLIPVGYYVGGTCGNVMHKAVGWMLREMGKRVSMDLLRDFLRQHAHEMPRTMLRYAIEKMSDAERKEWMKR